jgi:hypothetical protein
MVYGAAIDPNTMPDITIAPFNLNRRERLFPANNSDGFSEGLIFRSTHQTSRVNGIVSVVVIPWRFTFMTWKGKSFDATLG